MAAQIKQVKPDSHRDLKEAVDRVIEEHINKSENTDEHGKPIASVAAADKIAWAKATGADVQYLDDRLAVLCEEVQELDGPIAVPRYRLR